MPPHPHTLIAEWAVSPPGLHVPYLTALEAMEFRAAAIADGSADELIWLLEHPPIYTAGTSAKPGDLLEADRFPVYKTGRGGQYTYHGPGQQVIYVMLDVKKRFGDVRSFVTALEAWMLKALQSFDIDAVTHKDRVGVWVPLDAMGQHRIGQTSTSEAKIAAIGVRLKRWVSFHGMSVNVDPDLTHFEGIVPCGISHLGTTSLKQLGRSSAPQTVQTVLRKSFEATFGPTRDGMSPPYKTDSSTSL
ncbi:MAG: lipoyl(octanoyl) transferase LipB [Pseudomonadota bacterium]